MELLEIISHIWPIAVAIAVLIFDWGIIWQKMKSFVTPKEVAEHVEKVLEKELCNEYSTRIKAIELQLSELRLWKDAHEKWGMKTNEQNHLLLQEIVINLKRVCDSIDLKYIKQNGNSNDN